MPALTRWLIKTALVYLVLALVLGAVLAARAVLPVPEIFTQLGPMDFHLLMVGWVTQLIFGVAHWKFPEFSPELPRGDERVMWLAYMLISRTRVAAHQTLEAIRIGILGPLSWHKGVRGLE